jgi:hypothetical protein
MSHYKSKQMNIMSTSNLTKVIYFNLRHTVKSIKKNEHEM